MQGSSRRLEEGVAEHIHGVLWPVMVSGCIPEATSGHMHQDPCPPALRCACRLCPPRPPVGFLLPHLSALSPSILQAIVS